MASYSEIRKDYAKLETYIPYPPISTTPQTPQIWPSSSVTEASLEVLRGLPKIQIKHGSDLNPTPQTTTPCTPQPSTTQFQISDGENEENLLLLGVQKNGWAMRKPVTILDLAGKEILKVEFESKQGAGIFKSLVPPKRATITLLTTGNPIGSVLTKSNWLTNDFEICDEQGNVHFFIKSKEKIFSASEYPVATSDGRLVGKIIRKGITGLDFVVEASPQLAPIIKAIFLGFVMLLDIIMRSRNSLSHVQTVQM